jgi:hypothetical protein
VTSSHNYIEAVRSLSLIITWTQPRSTVIKSIRGTIDALSIS